MFRARLRPIAFTVALLFAGPALASEPSVEIVGERIELGDLNPTVPRELLHLDVGPLRTLNVGMPGTFAPHAPAVGTIRALHHRIPISR